MTKSRRFGEAAKTAAEAKLWDASISAAVHAAVNAVDALCGSRLGKRAAADRHEDAVWLVRQIPGIPKPELEHVGNALAGLLSLKFAAEYEERLCTEEECTRSLVLMERLLVRVDKLVAG